jgi:hypothetical protein
MVVGTVLLATTVTSIGFTLVAQAQGPETTTDVTFVPLATPYALFANKTIISTTPYSAVVIGGKTTVPTDATTVDLDVQAGGTTAGQMEFYPAGDLANSSGQLLSWAAGHTTTADIQVNVGTKNQVTFATSLHEGGPLSGASANATTVSALVTATIVGYSTQVTDGDVSGLDGSAGQVLTDNGTGAAWGNLPTTTAYASHATRVTLGAADVTVDSLTLPPGSYVVTDTFDAIATNVDLVSCTLYSTNGSIGGIGNANLSGFYDNGDYAGTGDIQMATTTTTGGTISLGCGNYNGGTGTTIGLESLIATPVNTVSGWVTPG